jgi:hypothetical protein
MSAGGGAAGQCGNSGSRKTDRELRPLAFGWWLTVGTAPTQAGTPGAGVICAARPTTTWREPGGGRERSSGCESNFGNNFSTRSTPVSPFRQALGDLGLTANQVWGLTKTDEEWSEQLEAALTATRRDDLQHGNTPAYVRGCVCSECREYQRVRMARNLASETPAKASAESRELRSPPAADRAAPKGCMAYGD